MSTYSEYPAPSAPETPAPEKKRRFKPWMGYIAAAVAGLVIGTAAGGSSTPAPTAGQAPTVTATETVEVASPVVTETIEVEVPADEPAEEAVPAATACDNATEAFLTGSKADIKKALTALIKDKTADKTAREYAKYYLERDNGDKEMQEMDASLISSACSIP